MTGRGRPNTRKPVLPNIAAAGRKKPENDGPPANGETRSSNRGRGRGQRGRGRGRGGGGGQKASMIVQSEGTFTMGLNEGALKSNRSNNLGSEEIVGKLDKSVNVNGYSKHPKIESTDDDEKVVERIELEEEWASDDDQDKIELYEILKSAFVSDIKKGREMPVVLPQKDVEQFKNLVQVQESKPNPREAKMETSEDIKTAQLDMKPTSAAEAIQKYINEKTNDVFLMQLPASLDVVHQNFDKQQNGSHFKMEVDDQQPQASSSLGPSQSDYSTTQKHCMDGLPVEAEIGKLQLLKNGQMRLVIGNRVMDMHEAIPSQMFETIVQTQITNNNGIATGSMTVLGNVGDSFLCTYNVP